MVKKLIPQTIQPNSNTLIVAARNRGKSTLAFDLLMHTRHNYDICLAICPTLSTRQTLENIIPKCFIYSEFDLFLIDNIINTAKNFIEQGKSRNILLFLDDCLGNKSHLNSAAIREIFLNGRHYKISTIICAQYLYDLNTTIRSNVDYVFALRESNPQNRKKLFQTFGGMFANEKEFADMLNRTTADFESMVIDLTCSNADPMESVLWYRAEINLPSYRVGRSCYFQIDREFRRSDLEQNR